MKLESRRIRNEETEENQDLPNTIAGVGGCFMQMWFTKKAQALKTAKEETSATSLCSNIRVKPHTKGNKIDKQ